jgi:hypothetical protein
VARPRLLIPAVLALAALAAAGLGPVAAGSAAGAAGPAATLTREIALTRAGQYKPLYQLYTPRFRAGCPYARFVAVAKRQRSQLAGITIRVIRQHISGNHGTVDYHALVGSTVVATLRGDTYTRIGGRWLDDVDKYTLCR